MRCLHLADLHLGWRPAAGGLPEELLRERDSLLARAVDLALAQRVDLVLIAGDLFDSHRPAPALVEGVLGELNRLVENGVALVTVPGNHDELTYHDSVYRQNAGRWPGLLVTGALPALAGTLQAGGIDCHIYSLAYTGGLTPVAEPLADFPAAAGKGVSIAVLHGSLDRLAGQERSLPLSGEGLARAGYDYVALGHFHRFQSRRLGRTLCVYPGAVAGKGFHDPGEGQWCLVTLGEGTVRLERLPAPAPAWRTVELDASGWSAPGEAEAALAALAGEGAVVRARLTGFASFPLAAEELVARLGGRFLHLEVLDETTGLADDQIEALLGEPTVRGFFARRAWEGYQEAPPEEKTLWRRALLRGLQALAGGEGR